MIETHLLSFLVFVPLLVGLILILIPAKYASVYKWMALGAVTINLCLSIFAVVKFDTAVSGFGAEGLQFVERYSWIDLNLGTMGSISIKYFLGVDGLSIALVLLSGIILFIGVISSWNIQKNVQGYFVLYLILSASVMGCFVALDFFLFYLFFEFMLLPMYFLIGLWGGERREYAAIKFFLYTLLGSILILMVLIGLNMSVVEPGGELVHTFDLMLMMDQSNYLPGSVLSIDNAATLWGWSYRTWAFLLILIGFAIKLPAIPVHTWLPDAHVEAPTPISVILAGVLLKIGGYGFYRITYSIFPEGAYQFSWWIGFFAILAIVYGALVAMAQKDLKRLIAYSSVSHMGFVMLGMAALTVESISGSIFQMFSHGILSAALFLIAGVIYDRTGDRMIASYGGLAGKVPRFTVVVLITFFAALGLPGFTGFIGEFLVLVGAFDTAAKTETLQLFMPVLGTAGLVLGAAYFLWTLQRMFFGEFWLRNKSWSMHDLTSRELLMFIPLLLLTFLLGIFPGKILDLGNETIIGFVDYVKQQGQANLQLIIDNR